MSPHEQTHLVVRAFGWWMLTGFAALGVWDLWLIYRGFLGGNSASGVILEVARQAPVWTVLAALCVGVLVGHFFWPLGGR